MSSRKPAARARQVAAFKAGTDDLGDAFERERERSSELERQRDEALYDKACASKKRYATKADAIWAIGRCEAHGTRGLTCYRCPYCKGWHLTSHHHDGARPMGTARPRGTR